MPPIPTSLPELVDQLGRTYSPFERLKILGRAWGLLRQMTPDQRLAVAAQLGLDNADEVVEAIAERSGKQASPALLSMIERAQTQGMSQLPRLLADLKDPGKRAARLRQGIQAAEEAIEQGEVPWLPPSKAAASGAAPQPAAARPAPAPQATVAPAPAPPPAAAAPAAAPAAPATAPTPVQAAPPPPVQTAPPPEPPKPAPPPAPEPARPPKPAPQSSSGLAAELDAAPSLLLRFRALHTSLEAIRGTPAGALRSVLEGFPDGWARRRALAEIFRAGVPADVAEAVGLLETLGAERDRLWCLGALTSHRQIPEKDREALLAGIDSPTARRRLKGRLARK